MEEWVMGKNYIANGDFSSGSFDGWLVNESYVKLLDTTQTVAGKRLDYLAGISPAPVSAGAIFQQTGLVEPGTYELSFAYGAGMAGEHDPERLCVGSFVSASADGKIESFMFDFVAKASLKYERVTIVVSAHAEPIRFIFGMNILGFQNSTLGITVGPVVVGDFELSRVAD